MIPVSAVQLVLRYQHFKRLDPFPFVLRHALGTRKIKAKNIFWQKEIPPL
jgi:hypothetical protein